MSRGEVGARVECPICGDIGTKITRNDVLKCRECGEVWQCVGCGMWLSEQSDHRDCGELLAIVDVQQ